MTPGRPSAFNSDIGGCGSGAGAGAGVGTRSRRRIALGRTTQVNPPNKILLPLAFHFAVLRSRLARAHLRIHYAGVPRACIMCTHTYTHTLSRAREIAQIMCVLVCMHSNACMRAREHIHVYGGL